MLKDKTKMGRKGTILSHLVRSGSVVAENERKTDGQKDRTDDGPTDRPKLLFLLA